MKVSVCRLVVLILLIIQIKNTKAQEEQDFRQMYVEAESFFLFEEYKDALPLYQRLLREDPDNSNLNYKIGICYLHNSYQKEKSISYLLEAAKNISENYKGNSHKERSAPPEVNFYLGQAYRINGNLKKALEYFTFFKRNIDPEVFDIKVVDDEIKACGQARVMEESPVYFKKINAGKVINTRFEDINPVISGNGKTMVFNRSLQFYDAVFLSTKDSSDNWSEPVNLTPNFMVDGNSYCTGITYNGDEIFVYRSDNYDGNIYSSKKVDGNWQNLIKLNDYINTKYWESHASPSPDGKYLYFTSNRHGGYGGLDIYKAPRTKSGSWGEPVNLGPVINSPYNEESPFISPSGDKLFFSSLGHNGMGGYDIFVSELTAPETWSSPVNMGFPLNTCDDDIFFCPADGKSSTALYSIYDPESSFGLKDIFLVQVFNSVIPRSFTVSGRINAPAPDILSNGNIEVSIIDDITGKMQQKVKPDSFGEFVLTAPQGEYKLLVDGEGIKPVTVPFVLNLIQEDDELDMPLITTQSSSVGEDKLLVVPAAMPNISIVGPEYISIDTIPVTIHLKVDKDNDLTVETFFNDQMQQKEEYRITKEDFAYKFSPQSGLNKIQFTIRNSSGHINRREINVMYRPRDIEGPIQQEDILNEMPSGIHEFATLSGKNLKSFLLGMNDLDNLQMMGLYRYLMKNAIDNNYTEQDVDSLFSVILTQRGKDEFQKVVWDDTFFEHFGAKDSVFRNTELPLLIVRKLREGDPDKALIFETNLLRLIPTEYSPTELDRYIRSFSSTGHTPEKNFSEVKDNTQIIQELIGELGQENTFAAIDKAATTRGLQQFYQNLFMSSEPDLKPILSEIDFDSLSIQNAIDLVNYLFKQAENGAIDKYHLIEQLEKAGIEENKNMLRLRDAMAIAATGKLKLEIQELDPLELEKTELTAILDKLLKNSSIKGYSKAEVYDLLIRMIGIPDVGEFVFQMKKFTSGDVDSLLQHVNINKFSTPLEVIQYLLVESAYYNYEDTDINNLLIRMLLEKGFDAQGNLKDSSYTMKLVGKKKVITTFVFVNLFLIILIILFWRRKRKKSN